MSAGVLDVEDQDVVMEAVALNAASAKLAQGDINKHEFEVLAI